jgi:hypothetical protein
MTTFEQEFLAERAMPPRLGSEGPREVAEHALAHSLPDKVEAAYRRGDLFEKRRHLMDALARHCAQQRVVGKVVLLGNG